MLLSCFFNKTYHGIDDTLIDQILNVVLGPVEGEKGHAFDDWTVGRVSACAIYYMCDLVEG
jgi:hypothetical protein